MAVFPPQFFYNNACCNTFSYFYRGNLLVSWEGRKIISQIQLQFSEFAIGYAIGAKETACESHVLMSRKIVGYTPIPAVSGITFSVAVLSAVLVSKSLPIPSICRSLVALLQIMMIISGVSWSKLSSSCFHKTTDDPKHSCKLKSTLYDYKVVYITSVTWVTMIILQRI
jgi:hypothetical protein